jgi:hypothetical protein
LSRRKFSKIWLQTRYEVRHGRILLYMLGYPTSHRSMAIPNFISSSSDEFVPFLTWKTIFFISQNQFFHFANLAIFCQKENSLLHLLTWVGISAANACLAQGLHVPRTFPWPPSLSPHLSTFMCFVSVVKLRDDNFRL